MHKLLLTRSKGYLEASRETWSAAGYDCIDCATTEIVPQPFDLIAEYFTEARPQSTSGSTSHDRRRHGTTYIITSGAAVEAGLEKLIINNTIDYNQRIITVGKATAERAKAAGFKQAVCVGDRAEELDEWVQKNINPSAPLIHLTAADQAFDLKSSLEGARFTIYQVICYQAVAATVLPTAAASALELGEISAIPFYSARSLTIFEQLVEQNGLLRYLRGVQLLAMSARIAERARLSWGEIRIASAPDETALIELTK